MPKSIRSFTFASEKPVVNGEIEQVDDLEELEEQDQSRPPTLGKNVTRIEVTIRGTRPLLQHCFGPDAIPLEKQERTGVAGNDPEEWKRSMMVTDEGQLYVRNDYVFGCLRNGSRRTKKGRGSIQPDVEATLEVEPAVILLDRFLPKGEPTRDPTKAVYIDVRGVVNKATKGRNVRYRLACSSGWMCTFVIQFDNTVVQRNLMKLVVLESGRYGGIGDGLRIGMGRFEIISYKELPNAENEASEGIMEEEEKNDLGS